MFGINAKEIFEQKISDVIVILFGIHLVAVISLYIIKWIQPLLNKRASVFKNKHPDYSSEYSLHLDRPSWSQNKSENKFHVFESDNDYVNALGNLKTIIGIAEDPSKAISDSSSLMKINMMSDSEFENALSLGNYLRTIGKNKCSSETQTIITINPKLKLDFSCPEVAFNVIPEKAIKRTDSSDSFLSLSSKNSSADFKREIEQFISELEQSDFKREKTDDDLNMKKLQKYLKASLAKTDVASSFKMSGKNMSQENKLLEMAIAQFEQELKPIKEQIQILKECISGFDLVNTNTQNSIGLPSDFNSSFSGSGIFSESLSGTTCCSTDLLFSSYHIISTTSVGSLDTDRYKSFRKSDKIASLHSSKSKQRNKHKQFSMKGGRQPEEYLDPMEKCKPGKRSPIAEMYVKLSQSNLQNSCLVKGRKEKVASSDNAVTYRIDLNVNLAGVPASNCPKSKMLKERSIQPLTSDPDDVIGKPSSTHVCLRPALK